MTASPSAPHTKHAAAAAKQERATTPAEPRSRLASFLLVLSFGYFGLHQIYLGHASEGWTRFGLGLASFPLMVVLIGYPLALVLFVWAIVDFFRLYLGVTTDADGRPLHTTKRDESWRQIFFIVAIIAVSLYLVGIMLAVALGILTSVQIDGGYGGEFFYDDSPVESRPFQSM